jgi:hypothetical protein
VARAGIVQAVTEVALTAQFDPLWTHAAVEQRAGARRDGKP